MYAKIIDNQVIQYPYGPGDLINDNPNISFPDTMSDDLLAQWNIFPVFEAPTPAFDDRTEKVELKTEPILVGGSWIIEWNVISKTNEEIAAYDQKVIDFIKTERNRLLSETDWMALSDNTLTLEWINYRQALRDVPQQSGFPYNVVWPTRPSN
jgi:hypothetical protein